MINYHEMTEKLCGMLLVFYLLLMDNKMLSLYMFKLTNIYSTREDENLIDK